MEHAELAVEPDDRLDGTIDVLDRAPPVERNIGLPKAATYRRKARSADPRGELEGIDVQLGQEVGARLVECGRDERDAFLP